MEMRTRILGKMLNSEVQDYLSRNDIIIVPVGTTEMHGGFPLDCETVISEAYCTNMYPACVNRTLLLLRQKSLTPSSSSPARRARRQASWRKPVSTSRLRSGPRSR